MLLQQHYCDFYHYISQYARNPVLRTEACGPAAETRFLFLCHLASSLSVHACHLRGVLPAYWVCRVFSESGD